MSSWTFKLRCNFSYWVNIEVRYERLISYHHLSMNDSVNLGQGTICALVCNQPAYRPTHHILIDINPSKFLGLTEYPHYKSGQP